MPRKEITIRCENCGEVIETHAEGVRFKEFYKCTHFYGDAGLYRRIGYYPICRNCVRKLSSDEQGNIVLLKFKEVLKKFNKPFLKDKWESAILSKRDTIGQYFTLLGNPKYGELQWKDSDDFKEQINKDEEVKEDTKKQKISNRNDGYDIEKLKEKYGYGYKNEEYILFEKKWNKLVGNYKEKTSFHIENLITYIRFRVKEEIATANGEVKEAKEWGALADKASDNAKINVKQLSKSDISGGVDLVCQIFEAVESEIGIIPLLPRILEQPYDDADIIIWCLINYGRRLEGKPMAKYKDIWNFYDKMLSEYFTQQGFNEQQIKEFKEKRNNVFRDLSKVYKEPLYESQEWM